MKQLLLGLDTEMGARSHVSKPAMLPERTEGNLSDGLVFSQLNSSGEGFSYSPSTPTLHAFPPAPCALSICPFLGKATLGVFFPPVNFFQLFIYVSSDLFLVNEFYALLL